ncbi:MAG: methylmalonyl Co-A mutase-associated GTPase MeaB [Planctomycetia bacterium]|nr:methylmalonyl Co-A mutase-associated GTPase MeaB [Planctomycetia bacterium]
MDEDLWQRFQQRDRRALSRLISLVARGEDIGEMAKPPAASKVVAITGGGGVGKSSLIGKLIERWRGRGQTIAVLACDPESPLSGGALLGDRFRMPSRPDDDGVFIRSLAAASGQGAVAQHLPAIIRLLEAFGFDLILLETVGAGQGDVAVHALADGVVLLLQPETGDDLQWEKAGVMEVADLIVIHKADLPGAEGAVAQVRGALDLIAGPSPPVLLASARTGQGLDELLDHIAKLPPRRATTVQPADLLRRAQETLAARFAAGNARHDPQLADLLSAWQSGRLLAENAAVEVLRWAATPRSTSG